MINVINMKKADVRCQLSQIDVTWGKSGSYRLTQTCYHGYQRMVF